MEFSYSTILGKITKKIDITKFLYIHFKKKVMQSFTRPPFSPTHKSQIPIGGGVGLMWHANQRDGSFGLYMPKAYQKNRPFGLWFEAEA